MCSGRQAGFATLLRTTRERRGVTQRQLADLSTESMRAIRNAALGVTRGPRRDTLRLIAQGLGLARAEQAETFMKYASRLQAADR